MAIPSCLWKTNTGNSIYKEFAQKSVVQKITIYSPDTSAKTVSIYRTPSAEKGTIINAYQADCKVRHQITINANATLELADLKWVFEVGDILSFSFTGTESILTNIYVDGVLFD